MCAELDICGARPLKDIRGSNARYHWISLPAELPFWSATLILNLPLIKGFLQSKWLKVSVGSRIPFEGMDRDLAPGRITFQMGTIGKSTTGNYENTTNKAEYESGNVGR